MAGKRKPTTDLNHDNWDQEYEPEEMGQAKMLSEDEAKKLGRKIIKARRVGGRDIAMKGVEEGEKLNPFAAFSGFQHPSAPASTPFAALSGAPKTTGFSFSSTSTPSAGPAALGSQTAQKPGSSLTPTPNFSFLSSSNPATTTAASTVTDSSSATSVASQPSSSTSADLKTTAPLPPLSSAETPNSDEKYAHKFAVGGLLNDGDVKLGGSSSKRRAYISALSKLNEAFIWKVLDTAGLAPAVKNLLSRSQLKELFQSEGSSTSTILTPCFVSYNKELEALEKQYPEYAVVFKNDLNIPGAGKFVIGTDAYLKKISETNGKAGVDSSVDQKAKITAPFASIFKDTPKPVTALPVATSVPSNPGTTESTTPKPFQFAKPVVETRPVDSFSQGSCLQKPMFMMTDSPGFGVRTSSATNIPMTSAPGFTFSSFKSSADTQKIDSGTDNPKPGFSFGGFGNNSAVTTSTSAIPGLFSFGSKNTEASDAQKEKEKTGEEKKPEAEQKAGFTFGSGFPQSPFAFGASAAGTAASTEAKDKPAFQFGPVGKLGAFPSFSFKPPAAAAASAPASESEPAEAEEEEEGFKVEVKEVEEAGSYFTVKVKMFHKVGADYVSNGVGNLHLKKTETGGTQVVVRADNTRGNVFLNVCVVDGQKCQRLQKTNVLFICILNPPLDADKPSNVPVPVLFRTKNNEEADKLFAELEKAIKDSEK